MKIFHSMQRQLKKILGHNMVYLKKIRPHIFFVGVIFILNFSSLDTVASTDLKTYSLGDQTFCSHKKNVTISKHGSNWQIKLNLNFIKSDRVSRALFHPVSPAKTVSLFNVIGPANFKVSLQTNKATSFNLNPPWYESFNITSAINNALKENKKIIAFSIDSFIEHWTPEQSWFEITSNASLPVQASPITEMRVFHNNGDTFITFKEIEDLMPESDPKIEDIVTAQNIIRQREKAQTSPFIVRYNIYRSDSPIDQRRFHQAVRLASIKPLSGYNTNIYGLYWQKTPVHKKPVKTFITEKKGSPLPANTGLYVHHVQADSNSYYAVVPSINGTENLENLKVFGPVSEFHSKYHVPVLQSEEQGTVLYAQGTIRHYVRWVDPPLHNLPGQYYNWIVALPSHRTIPAPLQVGLHAWGGDPWRGYGWWHDSKHGTILMATNDYPPQTWWYGYHESYNTLKFWPQGTVYNYTERRILSMMDWVKTKWKIDENKVFVSGASMGGSGASSMTARLSDVFAFGISWVGIHNFNNSPQYTNGFYKLLGSPQMNIKNNHGQLVKDGVNLNWYVEKFIEKEPSFLTFGNGKNDGAIGWQQAVEFVHALWRTKRPFMFNWGQHGHGERADFSAIATFSDKTDKPELDIRLNQSLPAFSKCSLDDNMGNGDPNDGDPSGQINGYLRWDSNHIKDTKDVYAINLYLTKKSPEDKCTVDVTPRRLQHFKVLSGEIIDWKNINSKRRTIQSGTITADEHRFLNLSQIIVDKTGNQLILKKRTKNVF